MIAKRNDNHTSIATSRHLRYGRPIDPELHS